jgi:hypothetical protein
MRAVRGFVSFVAPPRRRLFFRSRRDGQGGITSDRKDGPIGEMSDDESSAVKLAKCDLVAGFEEEVDNECCICLVDMEERKFRGKMDCCDHVVCWFCIQEWSQKTARTCPICQRGFHKCKKTKARRKKGRRHTSAQSSDRTKKKERTLWENVRRRFGHPPSSSVPHQSWSEAEDGDEVDAGEEEVILSPMHDSRDDGGVAGERASGTNSNADNGNSSSNEDGEEAANAGDRNNGSDSSSEGGGAGRDGRRVVDEEEADRGGGNVDEEAEEPEVVAAADVEEEAEEGNGVGRSADVSSSSSSSSREGEEGDAAADMADETTALISIFLLENDEEEEDVVADEKRKEKETEKEVEDEEEPTQESADTETNFVAGYDDDPKGKGKEQEEESGGAGKDDEEWERKGSESDDAYEEEEEEEEEEDSDYDGPVRLPEDN